MARIDEIASEYGLSEDQAITFERFAEEKFSGHIWLDSFEPGISPNPEEWYEQMATEYFHAARVVNNLAKALWKIDFEKIYRELSREERREIYRGK